MKKILGFNIAIVLLGLASMFTDISSEMIFPLLPLFITSVGGAGLAVGLIGGFAEAVSSILKIISGYLSDRLQKRKGIVISGYALSAISKILFSMSFTWLHVFFAKTVDRVGKGIREAPRDALISFYSNKKGRGKIFGFHKAMDTSGAIIGAILSLILFWLLGFELRSIFVVAAVFGFISLIPLMLVKDVKIKLRQKITKIGFKTLPKKLRFFLAVATVFALGNFTYMFFVLKAQEFFGMSAFEGTVLVLMLYAWFNIIYTVFSIPSGILSDKIGRKKVIGLGYLLFALTCIGFASANSMVVFIILFAFYGLVKALTEGNQRAFASDFAEKKIRGTALGAFHSLTGLAALPAGLIAGYFYEFINPATAFYYGAGMAIVSLIMFLVMFKGDNS